VKVPQAQWQYLIHDLHPGYISWQRFEANQKRLAENALGFGQERKFGPVREGSALLQGRVLCGICGERMGVHYHLEHGRRVPTYDCDEGAVRSGARVCQHVPGKVVDPAISDLLLELVQPLTLEIALAVQQEVEARFVETDGLRQQRVDRARYEVELARRRYMSVDPANRLVADALEAEWNQKLQAHAAAQEEYDRYGRQQRLRADEETRQKILSLSSDFPRLWSDPTLEPRERKRMLRLLIEDVTLVKSDVITAHVRLRGGLTRTLVLPRPVPIAQIRKTKPEVVAEVDRLLDHHCDREVADILNQQARRTWEGQLFSLKKIARIRRAFHLNSRYQRLRAKGMLTATEMSERVNVTPSTIHNWGRKGILRKHRYDSLKASSLYEPLQDAKLIKGQGGRAAKQPTFTVPES